MRCWCVFVSASSPSESARCTRIVCARTSLQWSASASLGRSPAYASTDRRVASRGDAAARIASTVRGASGRTSSRRGRGARRTSRTGFVAIRSPSTARCSSVLSRSSAWRTATGPAPAASRSACQRAIRSVFSSRRLRPPRIGRDVAVVEVRVVLTGLRGERDRVGGRPRLRHEVIERLAPGIERRELAELPTPGHLGVEAIRIPALVEGLRAVPVALAVPDRPLRALAMHAHRRS